MLFPERKSITAEYELSDAEKVLYERVTEYVREEMNRADRNANQQGGGKERVNVGFALMTLQRRLASSPFAIHRSIERRRERLESRLKEERLLLEGRGAGERLQLDAKYQPGGLSDDEIDELYEEDTAGEIEGTEEAFTDNATSAQTLAELEFEIQTLKELEQLSKKVVDQRTDAKWQELDRILDAPLMKQANGARRKLVLFTEFKDTLMDLAAKIRDRLGRPEAVVEAAHGAPLSCIGFSPPQGLAAGGYRYLESFFDVNTKVPGLPVKMHYMTSVSDCMDLWVDEKQLFRKGPSLTGAQVFQL